MESYLEDLSTSISEAVSKSVEDASKIGILFSGGLDSSLIAHLTRKHAENAHIMLYTVGTHDSYDLSNAKQASKLLGLDSKRIEIHSQDIIPAIPKLAGIIGTHHPVKISFELPLYLGLTNIKDKLILSGQGADELFGGYARYLKMEREELDGALKRDVENLMDTEVKMDYRIAEHFGKVLKPPYLEENVVKIAMRIPIEYKVNKNQRKIVLKEVALQLGLPAKLVNKEKKAAQYSSGIFKELRREAKKMGLNVNEFIEHLL